MGRDTAERLIVKTRESLRCVPTDDEILPEEFAGVVARTESLRGRMGESARGVEGGCLRVCWRRALGISPIPSFSKCRKARNLGTA